MNRVELRLAGPAVVSRVRRKKTSAGLPRRSAELNGVARREGGSNSVVESQPSKLLVAGSIPVSRSMFFGLISRRMLTCPAEAPQARRLM